MDFHSMIIKNIKYNIKNYIAFLLGNSLILCILFMFFTVAFSSDFFNAENTLNIKSSFNNAVILMVSFSIIFIIFSTISFTKYRGRELGVYFTIGFTSREIIRILSFENMIISIASFVSAVIGGSIFSKLFHMAIGKILDIEVMGVGINLESFAMTALISIGIFLSATLYQMIYLKRYSIVDILKSKQNGKIGTTSRIMGLIGIIAFITSLVTFKIGINGKVSNYNRFFTISILGAVISLYLLIGYSMTIIVGIFKRLKKIYNNNILFINSLNHRFIYFRTILYVVTLMVVGAMAFISMAYSSYKDTVMQNDRIYPNDISFIVDGDNFNEKHIKNIVEESCSEITKFNAVEGINIHQIEVQEEGCSSYFDTLVISEESYNALENDNIDIDRNEIVYIHKGKNDSSPEYGLILPLSNDIKVEDSTLEEFKHNNNYENYIYVPKENIIDKTGLLMNFLVSKNYHRMNTIVVSNEDYKIMKECLGSEKISYDILLDLEDGTKYSTLSEDIKNNLGEKVLDTLTIKEEKLNQSMKESGFQLFIYSFMGIMFLIGSAAVLYFKTITSVSEDKERSSQLAKIGMTEREINKLLMKELGAIFLVPPIIAIFITGYFLKALYNRMANGEYMWQNTLAVFLIYSVIQIVFYILTSSRYKKLLR